MPLKIFLNLFDVNCFFFSSPPPPLARVSVVMSYRYVIIILAICSQRPMYVNSINIALKKEERGEKEKGKSISRVKGQMRVLRWDSL